MRRLSTLVLVFVCLLSFGGCGNPENKENDILQIPTDTTNPIIEQPIDSNPINTVVKEIKSITDKTNYRELPDVEEPFFEDDSHIYGFGNPISQYVIVEYTDGSTENVKEALENGHIQITDLNKYSINYFSEPKLIETIVDLTVNGEILTADALEGFFSDSRYAYSFPSIKSKYVTVYYKDGTEQNVKDALAEGKIKISDLDWFGIQYYKEPIDSEDNIEGTLATSDESVSDTADYLAYTTDTRVFDSIRSMKAELEKNSQANNLSFYELQGLPGTYQESCVEWAGRTDYFIYYTNEDKVIAFMPFESESALSAMKDDWLSSHGTYENLLLNERIHDIVKTEIPTDSGIAYECTYSTSIKTGLKIRYYEYQDPVTSRMYILSVDLSPDGSVKNFSLFVFDNTNSFMCGGTESNMSLDIAFELNSVVVK